MLAVLLTLPLALQEPTGTAAELRATLEALRTNAPWKPEFQAELPRLPDLLRSGDPGLVAGGAYLAGRYARGECAAALLDTFDAWEQLGTTAQRCVLDALIRLEVSLEPGRLPPTRWCDDLTYVLLARDAEPHRDELLALFDRSSPDASVRWACAVTLSRLGDPRLAERLLSDDPWPVRVVVHAPGTYVGLGRGSGGMSIACGRPSWPPRVQYLLQFPGADEPLPAAVPSRRREFSTCSHSSPFHADKRAEWRRRLVGELLDGDTSSLAEDLDLEWGGEASFVTALREHLPRQRAVFEEVARELAARGLLADPAEALARTRFQIEFFDMRDDKAGGLPEPWLGADVVYVD